MKVISGKKKFHFLNDGGELGALTRNYNWADTPVGPIELWPQSLKSIVGTVLHSAFPMLLWWGDELIQFYNDAYRPSLGNDGKHPKALGQRAHECWQESWDTIFPMIEKVLTTGRSFFFEDQLVPIFRNGKLEDVYWTFSYSAVGDEYDEIKGVLVTCTETTEKVKNLKALKESNDQLEFAIEAAELATWDLDPQTNRLHCSARLGEWLGLQGKAEIALSDALELVEPKDRPRVQNAIRSAIDFSSGGNFDLEYTIAHAETKTKRLVRAKGKAWFNEDRIAYRFNGTLQDVTERAEAIKKIEESELQFRLLIEAAPLAIGLFIGKEKIIAMANKTFLQMAGKGPEIIGKPLTEGLPELKGQPFLAIQDQVMATGKKFEAFGQEVYLTINGEPTQGFYNLSYTPLFNSEGEVYALLDIASDVTEQVRFNKQIEQSGENLKNIIRQSPVAMGILKGQELVVEIANDNLLEIWGKTRDQVVGKSLLAGLPEVIDKGFDDLLRNVINTGERFVAHEYPVQLMKDDKLETKYINFVYEPLQEPDGSISGVMAVAYEVTEQFLARQKIEDIVVERTESLRRTNAELSQFAYIASHDLQEPARKISTFAEMLSKMLGENLESRPRTYLNKIEVASTRMLKLIRDVLAISQLSKGEQKFENVDLNEVITEVINDFELLIEEKGCIVNISNLPIIRGIPVQLKQLFANLISNALKFSVPGNTLSLFITHSVVGADAVRNFRTDAAKRFHKIEFADNGIGFDQRNATQIFDIFQRLHGRTEYEGTGIGLALCKKVVENHGGCIYATSSPGEGSTFTVILPV